MRDALNLGNCSGDRSRVAAAAAAAASRARAAPDAASQASSASTFYVASTGSDTAAGTEAAPFATPARAQLAARQAAKPAQVVIMAGKYHLNTTLKLTAADSNVAWVSGPRWLDACVSRQTNRQLPQR